MLGHQARFADAGLADHQQRAGSLAARRAAQRVGDGRAFALAADDFGSRAGAPLDHPQRAANGDGLVFALDQDRRGELVWRPFDLPALNEMQVGILIPTQRVLPHVTQNFVARMTRKLKQLEAVAATV